MLDADQKKHIKDKAKGVLINKNNFKSVMSKLMEVMLKEDLDAESIRDIKGLMRTKKIYKNRNNINFNVNEMDALLNSVYTAFIKFLNRGS